MFLRRGRIGRKRPEPERPLFLDEPVDVVLRSVLVVGHLEHAGHAEQRLLSVSVAHHLDTNRNTLPPVSWHGVMSASFLILNTSRSHNSDP